MGFAELRQLLDQELRHGPEASSRWHAILELLEQWPDDGQREAAFEYTRAHLCDWLTLETLLETLVDAPNYWPVLQHLTHAELLLGLLFDGALPDRWRAIDALGRADQRELIIPKLQEKLQADSMLIQHWAILALGELGGLDSARLLLQTPQLHQDPSLHRASGRALGFLSTRLPTDQRQQLLSDLLEPPSSQARSTQLLEFLKAQPLGPLRNQWIERIRRETNTWPLPLRSPLHQRLVELHCSHGQLLLQAPKT